MNIPQDIKVIPMISFGYWTWTPEACLFCGPKWALVREVFHSFPEETQQALTFLPKDGEWVSRIELWEEPLRAALPLELYAEAMEVLLEWALRCQKARAEAL